MQIRNFSALLKGRPVLHCCRSWSKWGTAICCLFYVWNIGHVYRYKYEVYVLWSFLFSLSLYVTREGRGADRCRWLVTARRVLATPSGCVGAMLTRTIDSEHGGNGVRCGWQGGWWEDAGTTQSNERFRQQGNTLTKAIETYFEVCSFRGFSLESHKRKSFLCSNLWTSKAAWIPLLGFRLGMPPKSDAFTTWNQTSSMNYITWI